MAPNRPSADGLRICSGALWTVLAALPLDLRPCAAACRHLGLVRSRTGCDWYCAHYCRHPTPSPPHSPIQPGTCRVEQVLEHCNRSRRDFRLNWIVGGVGSRDGGLKMSDASMQEIHMNVGRIKGIVDVPSNHSVDDTVGKLKTILQAKGITLFALIDHSGEAEKVGMKMLPARLLIFGNPKSGTPIMLAAPSSAIDLPLKILVWEDDGGKGWITYNSPVYLQERHNIPPDLLPNIAVIETLATKAAE